MKKIVLYILPSIFLFIFMGCWGENVKVKSEVFDLRRANEVSSDYMEFVSNNNFEESNKISSKEIQGNEEIKRIQEDSINGYKLNEVSEGADHAYFSYLVVREDPGNTRVDLDSLVIKVIKFQDEYLVDEVKASNKKQVYKVSNTLRIRDSEVGKSELLIRTKDLPKEVYPNKDNVVVHKEDVPEGDFSKVGIGFEGNKVVFTTTDGMKTFLALAMVEDTKSTTGEVKGGDGGSSSSGEVDKAIEDALEMPIIDKLVPYDSINSSIVEKLLFSNDDGELIVQSKEEGKGSGIRIYKNPTGELLQLNLNEMFPVDKYTSNVTRIDDEGVFINVTALGEEKESQGIYKIDVEELKVFKEDNK